MMLIDASQTVQCPGKHRSNSSVALLELLSNHFCVEAVGKAQPQDVLIVLRKSRETLPKKELLLVAQSMLLWPMLLVGQERLRDHIVQAYTWTAINLTMMVDQLIASDAQEPGPLLLL